MPHKCPYCQKPIAVKIKTELVTEEQIIDECIENNKTDEIDEDEEA